MLRRLARSFLPVQRHEAPVPSQGLYRASVEFALVLIEAETDEQLQKAISAVTEAAIANAGEVLQFMGPLVLVAFSGLPGDGSRGFPKREAFVSQLSSDHKDHVRVVHGCASAWVGLVGSKNRSGYTAILDGFDAILLRLAGLKRGEAAEHAALTKPA